MDKPCAFAMMTTPRTIRVLVADHSEAAIESLSSHLANDPRLGIVGSARNGFALIRAAQNTQPDLVIANIHLPSGEAEEIVSTLRLLVPEARIIVFTVYDLLMTRIVFLEAGANAVVQGSQLFDRISNEIRRLFPLE